MKDRKKPAMNGNRNPDSLAGTKAYLTYAATEDYKTEPETNIPIASDIAVEDAREWVDDGSRL